MTFLCSHCHPLDPSGVDAHPICVPLYWLDGTRFWFFYFSILQGCYDASPLHKDSLNTRLSKLQFPSRLFFLGGECGKICRFHLSFTFLMKIHLWTLPYAELASEFVSFRKEIRILFRESMFFFFFQLPMLKVVLNTLKSSVT